MLLDNFIAIQAEYKDVVRIELHVKVGETTQTIPFYWDKKMLKRFPNLANYLINYTNEVLTVDDELIQLYQQGASLEKLDSFCKKYLI